MVETHQRALVTDQGNTSPTLRRGGGGVGGGGVVVNSDLVSYPLTECVVFDADLVAFGAAGGEQVFYAVQLRLQHAVLVG